MTLRRKFIIALISMIFFMAIIFAAIALHSAQSLLGHAETYVQQAYSQHWNRLLSIYYEDRGTWDGVQEYVSKVMKEPDQKYGWLYKDTPRFLVFDQTNTVVAALRPKDVGRTLAQFPNDEDLTQQWRDLKVNDKTVGHYWQEEHLVAQDGRLARSIGASIISAMLIGLVVTSLVALLLGLAMTRHFTEPLTRLTEAVRRVGKGDLSPRVEVKGKGDIALLAQDFNRMTERLTRNEEVRRNMVADIAHELRTPLSVILGKLESIQEGVLPSTPETLLPIQDETLRLTRLVRDLQQLSLAEAGKLPLALQPINLRQLVERIMEQFSIEFEERQLHTEVLGKPSTITADPDRLTQVFVNLLGNALLHTPPGGSIRVTFTEGEGVQALSRIPDEKARRMRGVFWRKEDKAQGATPEDGIEAGNRKPGDWVRVMVEDTGEGIPKDDLEHIFDRFYRVDKARERENGGTGLGLAIAKEFIQAHGGSIEVESQLGVGTCFRIILPVKPYPELEMENN